MDKRTKYNLKQKQAVVKAVTNGQESCNSAARRIGATPTTVKRWVNHYYYQGIDGLKPLKNIYNGKFKIEVIRYMLKNKLSLTKTAALFGISNDQIVALWLKKYEDLGTPGLLKETRGRKKYIMARKPKRKDKSVPVKTEAKLAALQKEIEYLRAENAFLKKLDALIQKERLAQAQGRRPKSSRS